MNAALDAEALAERHLLLSAEGARALSGDPALHEQAILVASSFWHFTRYWRFRDADSGAIRSLEELWTGQQTVAEEYERHPRLIVLKSRKLGITTLETAFDAWTALTRPNSRVHLFSSKQMAARDILERVVFGLKQLPPWLRPPFLRETADVVALGAGEDVRVLQAYATSENTAVEQLATHSHVDELSRMLAPAKVMQAVEPTFGPQGSAHVLMTSGGSNHWTSDLYRRAKYGDTAFQAVFVPGDARPGRPPAFFEEKARTLGRDAAAREYPRTEEEALMSSSGVVFAPEDIETAHEDALGCQRRSKP